MTANVHMGETRIRELTPRGRGGVTVVEIQGPRALRCLAFLAPGLEHKAQSARQNSLLVRLKVETELGVEDLDEALIWERSEDCFELHIHGSPVLTTRVVELLAGVGATVIHPKESDALAFRKRAELALAHAPSEAAARVLLDQAGGALHRELERLRVLPGAEPCAVLTALLEAGAVGGRLVTPPTIVLAGPVNAGKSTLFNALVGTERVVVSSEEGTTRDAVRHRALLGAYAVDLVDTAGTRQVTGAAASVERSGQVQGLVEAVSADLVLWLEPGGEARPGPSEAYTEFAGQLPASVHMARLATKSDLGKGEGISCLEDPHGAIATVDQAFRKALGLPLEPWVSGSGCPFDGAAQEHLRALQNATDRETFERVLATDF